MKKVERIVEELDNETFQITRKQLENVKKNLETKTEQTHLKELEMESLRALVQELKKREERIHLNYKQEIQLLKQKVDELSQHKCPLQQTNSDQIRSLELSLYKTQLQVKEKNEKVERISSEKTRIQKQFAKMMIKNIEIVKELKSRHVQLRLENQKLKSALSLIQ